MHLWIWSKISCNWKSFKLVFQKNFVKSKLVIWFKRLTGFSWDFIPESQFFVKSIHVTVYNFRKNLIKESKFTFVWMFFKDSGYFEYFPLYSNLEQIVQFSKLDFSKIKVQPCKLTDFYVKSILLSWKF